MLFTVTRSVAEHQNYSVLLLERPARVAVLGLKVAYDKRFSRQGHSCVVKRQKLVVKSHFFTQQDGAQAGSHVQVQLIGGKMVALYFPGSLSKQTCS